ncbi:hypothetical protein [Cryptosporangium sp. NPDC048952]|uniref:hypothetical protein n=1 Tax=Cryptosporangium sp. NPDC048952 TaxID=3363961 RepID=UPI00371C95D9
MLVASRQSTALLLQQFFGTYLSSWLRTATKGRITAPPVVVTAPAGAFSVGDLPDAKLIHYDESPAALKPLLAADLDARRGTVVAALPELLTEAEQAALLLILDVTSATLPLEDLAALLSGPRAGRWPSSDVIAFVRADAIKRAAAKLVGNHNSQTALDKLDRAVGPEWRREFHSGGSGAVVRGYLRRLEAALPGRAWPAAVRVNPNDEPVFWLILITRQPHGAWAFADAVARARRGWRRTLRQAGAAKSPSGLAGKGDQLVVEGLQSAERLAVGAEHHEERAVVESLKQNLLATRRRVGEFRISDRPREVLDGLFGTADTAQIRAAVRELHAAGKTLSTGVGGDIRDHVLRLPDKRAR